MDAHTSYANDYPSKPLPVCPITREIVNNFSGLEMVELGDGHRCLAPAPLPPIGEDKNGGMVAVQ